MNTWLKRALIAVPVLIALFFGAILFYVNVLKPEAPDELTTEDLSAVVAGETTVGPTEAAVTAATSDPAPTVAATNDPAETDAATSPPPTSVAGTAVDDTWTVTDESQFGYRVEEVLFGVNTTAAGRGNQITGSMEVGGTTVSAATFTVDVASITSDENRRDNQFRGRIMEVEQYPEATFTLTAPIEFGSVPAAGEQLTATAAGDLTLHGVTQPVTFDVTGEVGDQRIGVLGSIPITFADYGITNPSTSGITTEDHGLLEFVLVFVPA